MTFTTAHLVGSINLPDADTVFRTVAEHLGSRLPRIPDGEVGDRFYWIQFQKAHFDATPGFSRIGDEPILIRDRFDARPFRLDDGVDVTAIELPALGYADAALDSYQRFAALKAAGVIPEATRFQVSLPTTVSLIGSLFAPLPGRELVEPIYARAMQREVQRMLAGIPHDQFAIQWDVAPEFAMLDEAEIRGRRITAWFGDTHQEVLDGVVERLVTLADLVPADVSVGYHLCYGDIEEHHFVEPRDSGSLAEVMSGLFAGAHRSIDFVHLPVPIERDDDAYFTPLAGVDYPESTEIYLGLIHHEDGVDGALRRATTAKKYVPAFGVATECGFGRGPSERTAPLLDLHEQVAARL
ncbi:MAG: hypothetical protein JWN80_1843 [Microbacteriaceae bacterium]|nr:hypothetical protein [Microbacteriaceae bacterium]